MDKKIKQLLSVANYLRHRENLTIAALSQKTGIPGMSISRIENGNWAIDISPVLTLAEYYGVSVDAILRNDFKCVAASLTEQTAPVYKMYEQFAKINGIRQNNGLTGEQWVYLQECRKLERTVMKNAVNANYADDPEAHFDILSFTAEGQPIVIEVKSTSKGPRADFYLSEAELQVARDCLDAGIRYEIHRVYYAQNARKIGCFIITAEELFSNYEITSKSYRIRKKKGAA